ncbi:MAG: hypothetical protein ACYCU0_00845 [Solirubrobacteraceae bacterium]
MGAPVRLRVAEHGDRSSERPPRRIVDGRRTLQGSLGSAGRARDWSLDGGGGGGGGAGGTAFSTSLQFEAGSFATASTSWIASGAAMATFGTAGEGGASGSLVILPLASG